MTPRKWRKRLVPPSPRRPKPTGQPDPGESLIQEQLTPLVEAHPASPTGPPAHASAGRGPQGIPSRQTCADLAPSVTSGT
jgi:hypothetical protein